MRTRSLTQKIGFGFGCIIVILISSVLSTLYQVRTLQETVKRFQTLRVPTAETGLALKSALNQTEVAIYAYLLTGEQSHQTALEQVWKEDVNQQLLNFEKLNPNWTNPDNRTRLQQLKPRMEKLRYQLLKVKETALTNRSDAERIYLDEVSPLVIEIKNILNRMINDQDELKDTELKGIIESVNFLNILQWTLLIAGLILALTLSINIIRAISKPITEAINVANAIALGELQTDIKISGFTEVLTLGRALQDMRDALHEKSIDTKRQSWLTNGQIQIDQVLRGENTLELVINDSLSVMAKYIEAIVGAIYLLDTKDQTLVLTGRFAFKQTPANERFKWGEGVIGQVAANKSTTTITELDVEQIRISSCLIDTPPRAVYIAPILFEDEVLGVVELGKLQAFTDLEYEFISVAQSSLGVSLNSALTQQKIKSLLEETQQQSEELQQQQEELEQTNEELEEQSQSLKEQQEELQATNEELEEQTQLITEKNQSLETARESIELKARQLEVSSKYKSEFLANMSHELRTPLNSLLILANELAMNAQGNLDHEQIESAQIISKSGNDLLALINDILDLSKVEAGKLDVNVSNVELTELSQELTKTFGNQAKIKGLGFEATIESTAPQTIKTDRQRLGQILNNLISNALKFTKTGNITVKFKIDEGGFLAIQVTDTGIGIPADKIDAVFEAFVQAEGGTSRKYGGTGLGLSISRELAKLLGGDILAQSEAGIGSTFTLRLPPAIHSTQQQDIPEINTQHSHQAQPNEPQDKTYLDYPSIDDQRNEISHQDRTILIIEDDNEFATLLTNQATTKGFKHINAATGEDGLRLAEKYKPDAIILDVNLPGIDGHTVLRELKNTPELRHIPVHIISATDRSVDPIKAGAVDFLSKPVTREQLNHAFTRIENFVARKVKNLLIVEDDDNLRQAIVKLIGNGDVKCLEADNGTQALSLLESNIIDCIVLDVGLPDMTGFELIHKLHASNTNTPPIIVYTGRELTREENADLEQYAETIIVKGVKGEERVLDETALFLHRTISKLPETKREIITKIYKTEDILDNKCVLIVDDDMRNVFALSKALKSRGMNVLKAENGVTALSIIDSEKENIDMVLMDIMMPEMDGYECMEKIRQRPHLKDLPVIALTAKAMKDDRKKCIDAGANDYIPKPIDIDRLTSLMRIWAKQ